MAKYIISEQQFSECFEELARHHIKIDDMTIVKHVDGSTNINKIDGTSSPSDYWEKHFNDPIEPSDMICTSCMKKADKFVVGHVEDIEQTKMWLYPVCAICNRTYKGNKSNHIFYADNKKLKEIDITH
ncbi:MAG TPA: hypothetical protein DCZ30_04535 [Clostridiales bacterium]|nr:hypothetical protein [Clostridiales bacterium]